MTRILMRKQLLELFSWLYQGKDKKRRSGVRIALTALLYAVVLGGMAVSFYFLGNMLCKPLVAADLSWLYMVFLFLISLALSVLGGVFTTYTTLYKSKDNNLLLSMPIPVHSILVSRLMGIFAINVLYELLVLIPMLVVFYRTAGVTGVTLLTGLTQILWVALLAMALSCILGWVIAQVSARLKNQKIVSVLIALVFLGLYYYLMGKSGAFIEDFLSNPNGLGNTIQGRVAPMYIVGKGAAGDLPSFCIHAVVTVVIFVVVYLVLRRNFLFLATSNKGEKKIKYVEKQAKLASPYRALVRKELRRLLGSSTYMLNCALGVPMMLAAAVFIFIKRGALLEVLTPIYAYENHEALFAFVALALCMVTSLCDISAPSVSLEGNSLWLTRVLPVTSYQILRAKRDLHFWVTVVPALVMTFVIDAILVPGSIFWVLIPVLVVLYVYLEAIGGVLLNLLLPNLKWTNEGTPVKRGASVTIALFGSWAILVALGVAGYFLLRVTKATYIFYGILGLIFLLDVLFTWLLRTWGARKLERL